MSTKFQFIVPDDTWNKVVDLKQTIVNALAPKIVRFFLPRSQTKVGTKLLDQLKQAGIQSSQTAKSLTNERLMQLLLKTKEPCCFAETQVGGGNWTDKEFGILSTITTSVPVTMYADAKWKIGNATPYDKPQKGHLFFTNGPVLNPSSPISKSKTSEYYQLTDPDPTNPYNRQLNQERYRAFMRERLLPIFKEAQRKADSQGKTPFVSIPGIGVSLFAGAFANQLKDSKGNGAFKEAVYAVLEELTPKDFSGVVRIDMGPIHNSCLETKGLTNNNIRVYEYDQGAKGEGFNGPGILALPSTLGITKKEGLLDDQFLHCNVVAGDPASYPGNDMHKDSSNTNEGAVGGSTNVVGLTIDEAGEWNNDAKEYHPTERVGWTGHNKPFVGAENPKFITVSVPKKMAADGAQKQTREEATTTKKARPSQKDLRLTKQGRAIVAILSLLTLGLYPLLRYVQSLVTGKPFSWGLPDSMYATNTTSWQVAPADPDDAKQVHQQPLVMHSMQTKRQPYRHTQKSAFWVQQPPPQK